jgi:hypothetical protein
MGPDRLSDALTSPRTIPNDQIRNVTKQKGATQ